MTLKNTAKTGLIILLSMVFLAILTTFFTNLVLSPKNSLFYGFIDHLFIINMILLLIGAIMFISQSGAYNSITYSINLFRARISPSYKQELLATADIEEKDISQYLRETYLMRQIHYKYTYAILLPAVIVFIGLMVYVTFIY